jgi:hypothetical protein
LLLQVAQRGAQLRVDGVGQARVVARAEAVEHRVVFHVAAAGEELAVAGRVVPAVAAHRAARRCFESMSVLLPGDPGLTDLATAFHRRATNHDGFVAIAGRDQKAARRRLVHGAVGPLITIRAA